MRVIKTGTDPSPKPLASMPRKTGGSVLPKIIVLAVLVAGGYFGWHAFEQRRAAKRARLEEYRRRQAEKERLRLAEEEAARRKNAPKTETKVEIAVEEEKKPVVKEKSEEEILREEAAARQAVWAQIAEARGKDASAPLPAFAGVRFGEPFEGGEPVVWGTVMPREAGENVQALGTSFAVYGQPLKKAFLSLAAGTRPRVWVTPQTRRPWRIEFARPLKLARGAKHDVGTQAVVDELTKRFGKAFVPVPLRANRAGCEYVFPRGSSTVVVAERDGRLVFEVEREDLKAEACKEAEARRTALRADEEEDKVLASTRYPHGKIDRRRYPKVRLQEATPQSFCGVLFASPAPEGVTPVLPQKGPKVFFLDYDRVNCRAFKGFRVGRAEVDPHRDGVYAVDLYSEGGTGGLDDKDHYASVKAALSRHYKVEPRVTGAGDFPQLVYTVGDVEVTFGPDPRGGFRLRAENKVLSALAEQTPAAPKMRK